ncbi:acyl-CoA N-acyltransferase [Mycena metata]|uniref:Acyl-CoA N-acyltransferase n=1 Tax=Mycena metata TaxID=1033252 RepID=A0AAD7J1M2_9AGAR|nr:acyl-CoA N-acyltransferase [Mycena metata]
MNPTYDVNFKHPLLESSLETSRVKLTPFLPHVHTDQLLSVLAANPEMERFLPIRITAEAIDAVGLDPESILFAVIDKTKGPHGAFAGTVGLLHASSQNRSTEIGPVICFPEFQRTFVNSNAVGILLRYCLNLPEEGGLGFRRVQWAASPLNTASIRVAERMGMKLEGTLRWVFVLPKGLEGKTPGAGRGEGDGRDSVILAAYWDDWENGGREKVENIMDRQT